jgi:hypothetical protein
MPSRSINPSPHYLQISIVADCWTTHLFYGAANSDALQQAKAEMAETTTLTHFPCGWLARESKEVWFTA